MSLYKRWIEKKEIEGMKVHSGYKYPHAFEWGLEHLDLKPNLGREIDQVTEYTNYYLENSHAYFIPERLPVESYHLDGNELTFPSTITTFDRDNNKVCCGYFPSKEKKKVIIVVPHWNSIGAKYDKLCRLMNKFNFSSIRISLPFHDKRGGPLPLADGELRSTLMVSANIGLTLLTMRQTVQDIISVVNWLEHRGYRKIVIMGTSIGSCAAFFAAAHDSRLKGFFANLMSSYFGEVVWTGISTKHIRKSVEPFINLEQLRNLWLLNSPIAFIEKIKQYNPALKQFILAGRFDNTFHYYLTELLFKAYDMQGISYSKAVLPCGHYTLGKYWFKYIDAYYILRFFRNYFSD